MVRPAMKILESLGVSCSNVQKLQLFQSPVFDQLGGLEEVLPDETILPVLLTKEFNCCLQLLCITALLLSVKFLASTTQLLFSVSGKCSPLLKNEELPRVSIKS